MPTYVVLYHEMPPNHDRTSHWDFMLERELSLATWALPNEPADASVAIAAATQLKDHRLDYLEYEGPISRNRGHVTQWDKGEFDWLLDADSRIQVRVCGERLRGQVTLTRLQNDDWEFVYSLASE